MKSPITRIASFAVVFHVLIQQVVARGEFPSAIGSPAFASGTATTGGSASKRGVDYTPERLSYIVIPGNLTVIQGDICYGSFDEFAEHANILTTPGFVYPNTIDQKYNPQSHPHRRSLRPRDAPQQWPGAKIIYKYHSEYVKSKVSPYVLEAIKRWQLKSPYLKFVELNVSCENVPGQLTINSIPCGGCNANLGYSPDKPLYMNLQQSSYCDAPGLSNTGCFDDDATHLFGHVIGLDHQAGRVDRDEHQTFRCDNLVDYDPATPDSCGNDNCTGWACTFRVDKNPVCGPYDIDSVMQNAADFYAKPGTSTLEDKAGTGEHLPRYNVAFPSTLDSINVCDLYPYDCTGFCGNGIVDPGEECDTGINQYLDGCTPGCKLYKADCKIW
ncbi:hypothetical protein BC938DRAFT_482927 [Jimgerdemannia flammicorona]|uniref:Peptidase metallopeptidase domain-containing protein n=1 Tax=Jimgerdemannia flammicorona TaxID=994334 RepID=A0A433QD28_9FUNG|nr:hypothetical protein BC938DRAFT_482927 [Jimgerdemannia flammicorona]